MSFFKLQSRRLRVVVSCFGYQVNYPLERSGRHHAKHVSGAQWHVISTSMLTLSDYLILTTPNFSENSEPRNIKWTETLPYVRELATWRLICDHRIQIYRVSPGRFNLFIFILRKNKCPNKLFKILGVTSRSLFGIEKEVNLHNNLATNAIIMS